MSGFYTNERMGSMTKDEVLSMQEGRELDILVSEIVMGNKMVVDEVFGDMEIHMNEKMGIVYGPLPNYSEDLSSSRMVVNKMLDLGYDKAIYWKNDERPSVICKAALLEVLEHKKQKERNERRSKLRIIK